MSALEEFRQAASKSTTIRFRGAWLVAMMLSQATALRLIESKIAADGLEHLSRALNHAADGHEKVAALVPVARREKLTGTANPDVLLAYIRSLGVSVTDPEIDGQLATAMKHLLVSQALIGLVRAQGVFTHEFEPAVDQCAALTSALMRAESEIRGFAEAATPVEPKTSPLSE